jgi:anaerobic nitric oxide reductase transcription regulator
VLFADALEVLGRYAWPGNVRELDNVLARSVLRAKAMQPTTPRIEIRARHVEPDLDSYLPEHSKPSASSALPDASSDRTLAGQIEAYRRRVILETVAAEGGNWAAAARVLGLHRANLHAIGKRLGLK